MVEAEKSTARVATMLENAKPAHADAFRSVNGADPDWVTWYAEYMIDPMLDLGLEVPSIQSLSQLLVALHQAYVEADSNLEWPAYYAQGMVQRFG